MVLTEDAIRRMVGRGASGSGGGGAGSSGLAGYATQAWVAQNFLSIDFFNRIFTAHSATGDVLPNDTETTITDIEAMFGFWTEEYISALGKNDSGGGGGGGSSTLAGLDDVQLSNPQNGQALVYNNGNWVNGTVIPDLTDYATKSWVQQQGYLTASALTGYATESWVQQQGYATETWVEGKGYALAANVYSKTDADAKFLTVAFFDRLFRAYNGTKSVNANDTTSTIDNIKAMFGFWTNQYISALGKNSSGGGGGGSSTLAGLDDVQFGTLANGQALVYDSTTGKWVNGTVIPDLTDYATKVWVQQQGYLTQHQSLAGYATESWVQQQGYITSSALTGYATQSWVQQQGYLTSHQSVDGTFWGQSWSNHGTVSGNMTNVGNITSNTHGTINNFSAIELAPASGADNGGAIYFHYSGDRTYASVYLIENTEGILSLQGHGTTGLVVGDADNDYIQIGNARLVWDSANNALKAIKADGTALNLYATGGLSALGMSAGASSIEAMTFNYLTVGTKITGGEGSFSKLGVSGKTTLQTLTVNGVTGFSQSVTFSSKAYFDDDIVINVGGTEMYLNTAKCVELGILS